MGFLSSLSSMPGKIAGKYGSGLGKVYGAFTGREDPNVDKSNYTMPGFENRGTSLLQQADFAAGRNAPQIAGSAYRGDQRKLIGMLQQQAAGQGPSQAQNMLRDAMGRNISGQQAMLATGGNARTAMQQASQQGASIANQSAAARIQEMNSARGLLGQTLQGARAQDLQRNQAQSDMELRSRGMNDMQIRAFREMELRNAQSQQRGLMGYAQADFAASQMPTNQEAALGLVGRGVAAYASGGMSEAGGLAKG